MIATQSFGPCEDLVHHDRRLHAGRIAQQHGQRRCCRLRDLRGSRLFRLVRFKWFANLLSFPHHDPHGIKDERIRDFIRRARTSRGSAEAGNPATPGGAVLEHRKMVNAVRKLVGYVRQPALIVHPLEDDYAAMSNATYLRDSLGGPVDLEVLDDCYHIVTVDRQRHLVVEAIDKFASALIGAPASHDAPALRARTSAA